MFYIMIFGEVDVYIESNLEIKYVASIEGVDRVVKELKKKRKDWDFTGFKEKYDGTKRILPDANFTEENIRNTNLFVRI